MSKADEQRLETLQRQLTELAQLVSELRKSNTDLYAQISRLERHRK